MAAIIRRYNSQVSDQISAPVPVRASQTALGELGQGLDTLGDAAGRWQDELDTATAKDADAKYSDFVREQLYGDNGYMYLDGANAITRRRELGQLLEDQYRNSFEGMTGGARKQAERALEARRQQALQSIDQHAAGATKTYLNDTSEARVTSMANDAIYNLGLTGERLGQMESEIRDMGARMGWPPEKTELVLNERRAEVYAGQVSRLMVANPEAAMDYLNEHREEIGAGNANALRALEATVIPAARKAAGRRIGMQEALGFGDMTKAFTIAQAGVGGNETTQAAMLQEFLQNGGQNLNPAQTAWCAAYVNSALAQAGIEGTGSLLARSFLDWGVETTEPERGDIVVLSRGDSEIYGHVGFFDGYNDDGTIRILGGNQSDSVNVQGYDPGQVLGFRRAAGTGPADPADAIKRILAIEDDDTREAAYSAYTQSLQGQRLSQEMQRDEAIKAAEQVILNGGSVYDLSPEQQQALGGEGFRSVRAYEQAKKSNRPIQTDQDLYYTLYREAYTNPREFAKRNPAEWLDKLEEGDRKMFERMWGDARSGTAPSSEDFKFSRINSMVTGVLNGAGLKDKDNSSLFLQVTRWMQAEYNASGTMPTEEAIIQQIRRRAYEITLDPWGFANKVEGTANTIDYTMGTPDDPTDDPTAQQLTAGKAIKINNTHVDPADVETAIRKLTVNGKPPTAQQIVEFLLSSGAY